MSASLECMQPIHTSTNTGDAKEIWTHMIIITYNKIAQ